MNSRSSPLPLSGPALPFCGSMPPAAVSRNTGSLALGGALATIAVTAQLQLLLVLVGGLFVVEAVGDHRVFTGTNGPANASSV